VFLSGTLLNVATVLIGTTVGLLLGARLPARLQQTLTDGIGLFVLAVGFTLVLRLLLDATRPAGTDLTVLAALLAGAVIGEILRLSDRIDELGSWFQRRLARGQQRSRVSEAFVTASLVFCVGPLTILGSLQNGLTGDIQLLAVKSMLDGVASIAFAAALGAGVYLAAITVFVVQGGIAGLAALAGTGLGQEAIDVTAATGGLILLGVGLILLDIRRIRVANFLPALVLAPIFTWIADALRAALAQ
jgi:uncharacterized membrane protein YqgA involved in biofilm formation